MIIHIDVVVGVQNIDGVVCVCGGPWERVTVTDVLPFWILIA